MTVGNLKASAAWTGPILSSSCAGTKGVYSAVGVITRSFLTSLGDPSLLLASPRSRRCGGFGEEGFRSMWTEKCRGDRAERAPNGTERHRLGARAALALVSDAVLVDLNC